MSDGQRRAFHEAAHALLCVTEGIRLHGVCLRDHGSYNGVVEIDPDAPPLSKLRILVAGLVVDVDSGHPPEDGPSSDLDRASHLAADLADGDPVRAAALMRAVMTTTRNTLIRNRHALESIAVTFAARMRMGGNQAEEIVEEAIWRAEAEASGMTRQKFSAGHAPAERWTR